MDILTRLESEEIWSEEMQFSAANEIRRLRAELVHWREMHAETYARNYGYLPPEYRFQR